MASSSQQPPLVNTEDLSTGDPELEELNRQLVAGSLEALRGYLARTRASGDWQDRIFVLGLVAPKASLDTLDPACESHPNTADVYLIRCAYFAELAITMRGTGTCDQVGRARFQNSGECVKAALSDMARAAALDSGDPTSLAILLAPLTIFNLHELQQKIFVQATALAPNLVHAHYAITTARSQRWGGSHRASLGFARGALAHADPGTDMAGCLFRAHQLVHSHYKEFDNNPAAQIAHMKNAEVRDELNSALEKWLAPPYKERRSSIPYLRLASSWYRSVKDEARQKRVIAFTGEQFKAASRTVPAQNAAAKPAGGILSRLFGSGTKP